MDTLTMDNTKEKELERLLASKDFNKQDYMDTFFQYQLEQIKVPVKKEKKDRSAQDKKYREEHREERRLRNLKWKDAHPWFRSYKTAQTRCLYDPNSSYYKRCIPFECTVEDFKIAWFRDKAYDMAEPSIDRKEGGLGYTPANIQYLELEDNQKKPRSGRWMPHREDI